MKENLVLKYYNSLQQEYDKLANEIDSFHDEVISFCIYILINKNQNMREKSYILLENIEKFKTRACNYRNERNLFYDLMDEIDKKKSFKYIKDVTLIFCFLSIYANKIGFSNQDIIELTCITIKNNAELLNKNKKILRRLIRKKSPYLSNAYAYMKLNNAFNLDGTLIPNTDPEVLNTQLSLIFNLGISNHKELFERVENKGELGPEKFLKAINRNLKKVNEHQRIETIKIEQEKNKNQVMKDNTVNKTYKNSEHVQSKKEIHNALAQLANYYLDGEIIAIPPSMEEFNNLLINCGFHPSKIERINEKMRLYINNQIKQTIYKKYMDDDIYEIYLEAQKENNNTIKYFINEIDSAIILLEENPNENDILELKNIINDSMTKIKEILDIISKKYTQ